VVKVDERVYISGENLVYLHVEGTGWLFENKEGVTVLRRIPQPKPKTTEEIQGIQGNQEIQEPDEHGTSESEKDKEKEKYEVDLN